MQTDAMPSLFALDLAEDPEPAGADLVVRFEVAGPPVGAARPRVVRLANGTSHTFMPDKPVAWEERCRQIAVVSYGGETVDAPVWLELTAWVSRPKRLRRRSDPRNPQWAGCKPDLDNVVKLAQDALVKARVIRDDTLVAEIDARRLYLPITLEGTDIGGERVEIGVGRCPVEVSRG